MGVADQSGWVFEVRYKSLDGSEPRELMLHLYEGDIKEHLGSVFMLDEVRISDTALAEELFLVLNTSLPQQPTGLKAAITRNFVLLPWSDSEDAEGYVIYRGVVNQGEFEEICTTDVLTFRNREYATGDDFNLLEYYLVARNEYGNSEPSAIVSLRPKGHS